MKYNIDEYDLLYPVTPLSTEVLPTPLACSSLRQV
jgi:hypothetical protein